MKKYLVILFLFLLTSCSSLDWNEKDQFVEVWSWVYKKVEELKTIWDTWNLTIEELRKLDKVWVKNEKLEKLKQLCKDIGIDNCLYLNGNPRYYFEYNKWDYWSFNSYSRQDSDVIKNIYVNSIIVELKKIKTSEDYIKYLNNFWKPEYWKKISDFLEKYTKPKKSPEEMNFVFSYFIDHYYNGRCFYGLNEFSNMDNSWFSDIVCTRWYELKVPIKSLPNRYTEGCLWIYKERLNEAEENSPESVQKRKDDLQKEILEIDYKISK